MTDSMLEEIYEVRRKLWQEGGNTLEGYSRHCEAVARDFQARAAAETARKRRPARRKTAARNRRGQEVTP